MAWFAKLEIKAHAQSLPSFPALYVLQGLKRTIWCESFNMLYLSLAGRNLLGCPDAMSGEDNGCIQEGCLGQFRASQDQGLSSRHMVSVAPESLRGRYPYKITHSFLPELAHPGDFKHFHSKATSMFPQCRLE